MITPASPGEMRSLAGIEQVVTRSASSPEGHSPDFQVRALRSGECRSVPSASQDVAIERNLTPTQPSLVTRQEAAIAITM